MKETNTKQSEREALETERKAKWDAVREKAKVIYAKAKADYDARKNAEAEAGEKPADA